MTNFDGLPLNTEDALGNIKDLLIAAGVALNSTSEDIKNVGLSIIELATDYSIASHNVDAKPKRPTHELNSCRRQPLTHPTTETIGARILAARNSINMNAFGLSQAIGVPRSCVEAWEADTTVPGSDKILPLASILRCDPLWLLGDSDGTEPPALIEKSLAPINVMQGVDMSTIGNRIRQRRNELSMSTMDLAKSTSTHLMDVVNWESGLVKPEAPHVDSLAKALNTSVTWLLTGRHIDIEAAQES